MLIHRNGLPENSVDEIKTFVLPLHSSKSKIDKNKASLQIHVQTSHSETLTDIFM